MSENKEGKIMWVCVTKLFPDKESAERYRNNNCDLCCSIQRVRVTPEPEPERFYVKEKHCDPIKVMDAKFIIIVAEFFNPLGSYNSMLKRAKDHAAWLNEEAKKEIGPSITADEVALKIKQCEKEMQKAAKELRFEDATKFRDLLRYYRDLELLEDNPS